MVTKYRDEDIYRLNCGLMQFVTGGSSAGTKAFIVTLVYTICPNYLAALQLLELHATLK